MSSNLECLIFEAAPGQWYYALESDFGHKNAWDWREEASAYGPFDTNDAAVEHLLNNHSNPGGWSDEPFNPERPLSAVMQRLVAEAPANMKSCGPTSYLTTFSFR